VRAPHQKNCSKHGGAGGSSCRRGDGGEASCTSCCRRGECGVGGISNRRGGSSDDFDCSSNSGATTQARAW
jgi:hypothetical protein